MRSLIPTSMQAQLRSLQDLPPARSACNPSKWTLAQTMRIRVTMQAQIQNNLLSETHHLLCQNSRASWSLEKPVVIDPKKLSAAQQLFSQEIAHEHAGPEEPANMPLDQVITFSAVLLCCHHCCRQQKRVCISSF